MTPIEKGRIRVLLESQEWKIVESLINQLCDKALYEQKISDTEWETMQSFLVNQGVVKGLNQLRKELFSQAHE